MKSRKQTQNASVPATQPPTEAQKLGAALRLATRYWLETVEKFIRNRHLRGAELCIARDAFERLQKAASQAEKGNASAAQGRCALLVDCGMEKFRKPEALLRDASLKPETLAAIAAPLAAQHNAPLSADDAMRRAHDLIFAAQRYLNTLPAQEPALVEELLNHVTFEEIAKSNRDGGKLPLLPLKEKKKGWHGQTEKPLPIQSVRRAVEKWLRQHHTETDIEEDMRNGRISFDDLTRMRWQRFEKESLNQQARRVRLRKKR